VLGETNPVGARSELAGRDKIIMTEWGPYDWREPMLQLIEKTPNSHHYRLLGDEEIVECGGLHRPGSGVTMRHDAHDIAVTFSDRGKIIPYVLVVRTASKELQVDGIWVDAIWASTFFNWTTDPRDDVEAWHREAEARGVTFESRSLDFRFGGGGPSALADVPESVKQANIGGNNFGTIATTTLAFPAGAWRIRTSSDDGIHVWVNDELVIDDWTWHVPTRHDAVLTFNEPTQTTIRVEHFELDGHAELIVEIEPGD